ncbi:MAG: DUF975 family protein [Clostridia bacterium]|nr:DUF975 family protein [Clostridia bacterium]
MNRAELKAAARVQISGKIGILFVISLIVFAISFVAELLGMLIPGVSLAVSVIVTPAFMLSMAMIYLNITDGIRPTASDAFIGFEDFWSAFKVTFLMGIYTALWMLLFIIPGIIKAYSYSMSLYILAENKGKSARECIRESMAMTEGYKMDLFVLDLSFIGWALVTMITFGLAGIWVGPYMQATRVNAYRYLKSKQEVPQVSAEVTAE